MPDKTCAVDAAGIRAAVVVKPRVVKERALISQRTKAALKAAKARGVRLGNPQIEKARATAIARIKADAKKFAANVLPVVREAQKAGASSLRAIAKVLNDRGVRTARGGKWAAPQVRDILRRTGHTTST